MPQGQIHSRYYAPLSFQQLSSSSVTEENSQDSVFLGALKSSLSAAVFVALDIFFRRGFVKANLSFPSSLAGCATLFTTLLLLPNDTAESVYSKLRPGADLLAKWLPVFFVPSLVTLPLADSPGSAAELVKLGLVIVGGFLFTMMTTSLSVVAVRKLSSNKGGVKSNGAEQSTTIAAHVPAELSAPPKDFPDALFRSLTMLAAASGLSAIVSYWLGQPKSVTGPLASLLMLSTTLLSFVFGARLPQKLKKVVHPLVTCTSLTWATACVLAAFTDRSFYRVLKAYRTGSLQPMFTGAGDVLLALLGPAVISLAISMYSRRQLMKDNLKEVGTAVGVSTLGGLFGTALSVRWLDIASPYIRLSLLSRNITSPLAMAIAGILGADVSFAVSIVVVTGLIGANFGASILDLFRIKDPVARGLGIGAAAHGLGTAAFTKEKDAFPFAAIGMALTASAATVTVSIPFLRKLLLQLALG